MTAKSKSKKKQKKQSVVEKDELLWKLVKICIRLCVGFKSILYLDIILHPRNQYVELAFGEDRWDLEIVDTYTEQGIKSHHHTRTSLLWKVKTCSLQPQSIAIFSFAKLEIVRMIILWSYQVFRSKSNVCVGSVTYSFSNFQSTQCNNDSNIFGFTFTSCETISTQCEPSGSP